MSNSYWANIDVSSYPIIHTPPPGPKSTEQHQRTAQFLKGFSSQVRLFPVVFESGHGVTLTDVDGNTYVDFSSGIYVTGLGHAHPKITEAIRKAASTLQNAHDFSTPYKMRLVEKLNEIALGEGDYRLNGVQFYDSGAPAVEAGLRVCRVASGKSEFISFHRDFHGKTLAAASCGYLHPSAGLRAPGFYVASRCSQSRCSFKGLTHPDCGLFCLDSLRQVIEQETTKQVAAIVLEPIQGWAGTIIPPDGWIQGVRTLCDEYNILMMADEILTGMGRTGKMFAMEHWETVPDVMTLGKGLGNGFPVTAMLVSEQYKDRMEKISASTSCGGNPMACAAALAVIEVIEEEDILNRATHLGQVLMKRLEELKSHHPIVGDVRGTGCLLAMDLVKDPGRIEPFVEAGQMVYQKAFAKGVAWIPAGATLRLSPPMIMQEEVALKAMDIIEEAIWEVEKVYGCV